MNQLKKQQHIRLAKVERKDAWLIVAIAYEMQGSEMVVIAEPKVVKIIPKQNKVKALAGTVSVFVNNLLLSSPQVSVKAQRSVVSPFFSTIFGYSNSDLVITQAARPPTL